MKDLERLINEVNGSMSMEGMPLTEDDKNTFMNNIFKG